MRFWKSGAHLGPWLLERRIGEGGNGQVWEAVRAGGSRGALKILHDKYQLAGHKRFKRFKDEIYIQASLTGDDGVLPVIDYCLPDSPGPTTPAWLVTSLAEEITDALGASPDLRTIVSAILTIAKSLAFLHARGISHRDVKPSNLYRYAGAWVVGDFGLVDFPSKEGITEQGEKLGPQHFLAPEMVREASEANGIKADVYSIAKTLWVLATGNKYPPPGELRQDSPQLAVSSYVAGSLSLFLDRVIDRCTRHDPEERPTMAEFTSELQAALEPLPVPTSPADLRDISLKIAALAAPARRKEDLSKQKADRLRRLADVLEARLSPLRRSITDVFGNSPGIPVGFSHNDGNVQVALPARELADSDSVEFNDYRTLCVYINKPTSFSLYSGFGLDSLRSGRIRMFAGHAIRKSDSARELTWYFMQTAWPDSADQEQAFANLVSGLNEHLRPALERLVNLMEAYV